MQPCIIQPSWSEPRKPAFQTVDAGVRALLHFFGRMSEAYDGNEWDGHVLAILEHEIALVSELHPGAGMSYGPPRVLLGADTFWAHKGVYVFQFGAYGCTHVLAYGSVEDALESAAALLPKGCFTDIELPDGFDSLSEDEQCAAHDEATTDLTYTESGYLASWEWTLCEMDSAADLLAYVYRGEV